MVWDRQPAPRLFRKPLRAIDLYSAGVACHSTPVAFIPVIVGALNELQYPHVWQGTDAEIGLAMLQVNDFIGRWGTADTLCTPLPCGDDGGDQSIVEYIVTGDGCGDCGECEMAGCSIPYGVLRWNDGVLQYQYCGAWYDVPGVTGVGLPPTEDIDPPPVGIEDSNACGIAYEMARNVQLIGQFGITIWATGFNPVSLASYIGEMQNIVPGIDLAVGNLSSMWAYAAAFNTAGLQNEIISPVFEQYFRCAYRSVVGVVGNNGIDSATYEAMKAVTENATQRCITEQDLDFGVLNASALGYWQQCIYAIGALDAKKLTTWAQPKDESECDCPESALPGDVLGPTAAGWYFGDELSFDIGCPGGFSYGNARFYAQAEHDVYGAWFAYEYVSGANKNSLKRSQSCALAPDVCFTQSNSDNHSFNVDYLQVGADSYTEISALFANPVLMQLGTKQSHLIASPVATQGQLIEHGLAGQAQGDPANGIYRFKLRWLYNTNSPSHGA